MSILYYFGIPDKTVRGFKKLGAVSVRYRYSETPGYEGHLAGPIYFMDANGCELGYYIPDIKATRENAVPLKWGADFANEYHNELLRD